MANEHRLPAPIPSRWTSMGPAVVRRGQAVGAPPVAGRTNGIAISRHNAVMYIATANGGVWRSDDQGHTWRPLMESQRATGVAGRADSLAIGAVAIHPDHPDIVHVGTGEAFSAIDSFLGVGPLLSTDGGRTWTTEAVAAPASLVGTGAYALAMDPTDRTRLMMATPVGLFRREPVGGGFQWVERAITIGGVATTGRHVTSVVCSQGVFYCAVRNDRVYRSGDQGATWAPVGTGFPAGAQRITLAVAPSNPNVIYALRANGRIHRLDHLPTVPGNDVWRVLTPMPVIPGGGTFVGDQGWYDLEIAVFPNNPDRIVIGGATLRANAAGNLVAAGGVWSSAIFRCEVVPARNGAGKLTAAAISASRYIGATIHADIHALVFPPDDPRRLWVGCDGGVFVTDNPGDARPTFVPRNSGLATLLMNGLAQHPTEEAVLFAGTQDNGGLRSIGDEAWLHTTDGDAGYGVVDWANPYRVLMTFIFATVQRCSDGGNGIASWHDVVVPLPAGDSARFYAPLVGTPYNPAVPAQSTRVAFGSQRVWISDTFGSPAAAPASGVGDWRSIPNNTGADALGSEVSALVFASHTILYAGTSGGRVYRFVRGGAAWTRTRLDNVGGPNTLGVVSIITDIEPDPADATGNSIYVVIGGTGDRRHVWRFDGGTSAWTARSGPTAIANPPVPTDLLDLHASALVADPGNPTHLYLGTDLGVWRSIDGGGTWNPFSEGLPEAAVSDLLIHVHIPTPPAAVDPARPRLLRVATHGRGVWERRLPAAGAAAPAPAPQVSPVELWLRENRLDLAYRPAVFGAPDPTASGSTLAAGSSPDIIVDAPDPQGRYQFPVGRCLDVVDWSDRLTDEAAAVPTHTWPVVTRVHVLVHNRGPRWANAVRVHLLLAAGHSGALPQLPEGYRVQVQDGRAITGNGWATVGIATLGEVRDGLPAVATFDLPSTLLPAPGALPGAAAQTLLALVHHGDDPFLNPERVPETLCDAERKAARRHLTVVAYAPAIAPATAVPPRWVALGPAPVSNGLADGRPPVAGRTPGIAVARDRRTVYIGTANGGVWRSDDAGASWRSLMEGFDLDPVAIGVDSLACPAVAIHPDHPERVYVGTGEAFGNIDAFLGVGPLISTNGGRDWLPEAVTPAGSLLGFGSYAVVVDPGDPERAVLASRGGLYRREPVVTPADGRFHWNRVQAGDWTSVTVARAGGATTWFAARRGGPVSRSADGAAWAAVGPGLALGGRITLACRVDDPGTLYAVDQNAVLQRFATADGTWRTVTGLPVPPDPNPAVPGVMSFLGKNNAQGWYDLAMAVAPDDSDLVYLGGSTVFAADGQAVAAGGTWSSSIYRCVIAVAGTAVSMAPTYIGASAHADVHALVFTPGDAQELWVGCDGGVFKTSQAVTGTGRIFRAMNRYLDTMTFNALESHPLHDAVIMGAAQDNGAMRMDGGPVWREVADGDSGQSVYDWSPAGANPAGSRVLNTYIRGAVRRSLDGGTTFPSTDRVDVPLIAGERVLFYAPMVGAPRSANAAESNRVVFGSQRLWLTDTFGGPPGGDWRSLPTNAAADFLPGGVEIRSIAFLHYERIVVGTMGGRLFLFEHPAPAGAWLAPAEVTPAPAPAGWPGAAPVTAIIRDATDAANRTFLVCFGGVANANRVWRCVVTQNAAGAVTATAWTNRSGTGARRLPNVQHSTLASADGITVFVGTDIGVWRSPDGGAHWDAFSEGLPDSAVLDLELASVGPVRLLRAGLHGRGAFERRLDAATVGAVELLVRDTDLDRGWRAASADHGTPHPFVGLPAIAAGTSPDIRIDAPLDDGTYQHPPVSGVDEIGFAALVDRSSRVATHADGILSRVYVQVHNRGLVPADGAVVAVLLAEAPGGVPPALPAGYRVALVGGFPIDGGGWTTLAVRRVDGIRPSRPAQLAVDLPSDLLPAPGALAGHDRWCVLVLTHHDQDPFPSDATDPVALADAQRHAAWRLCTVRAFPGAPPALARPPRHVSHVLPLAVACVAARRLEDVAALAAQRVAAGAAITDTDRRLAFLAQSASSLLGAGPTIAGAAALPAGLGRFVLFGCMGWDLADWADWLEDHAGWSGNAIRRGSADPQLSATLVDSTRFLVLVAEQALARAADDGERAKIRAFVMGMAAAMATDLVARPVLAGAAAGYATADLDRSLPGVAELVAGTAVSRQLFAGVPETAAWADWWPTPGDVPGALIDGYAEALRQVVGADLAARRFDGTPAPDHPTPPRAGDLSDGLDLFHASQVGGAWGMGIWFLVMLPVVVAPSLAVLFSRLPDAGRKLTLIADDAQADDHPVNAADERSWYETGAMTLGITSLTPFIYSMVLWAQVPRRNPIFIQALVLNIVRLVLALTSGLAANASPEARWGAIMAPWLAIDVYFLVRSIVAYAQGKPGTGLLFLMQTLPLMSLGAVYLFCLLTSGANLRKPEAFWPLWALFTGLLLGAGVFAAWRLSLSGGVPALLRDRRDRRLPDLRGIPQHRLLELPPTEALVSPDTALWQHGGATVAHERHPASRRTLLRIWLPAGGLEVRRRRDEITFRLGGVEQAPIALPRQQTAAQLAAQLVAAVPGLQTSTAPSPDYDLPWPLRLSDGGDEQATLALHDAHADDFVAVGSDEAGALAIAHAPRSATAARLGAPASGCHVQQPLRLLPSRDAFDPAGADLAGTAIDHAADLAALLGMGLAPTLLASPTVPGVAGNLSPVFQVFRQWNLDERRENEWRLLLGLDAASERPAAGADPRVRPGAPASAAAADGEPVATALGWIPTFRAWSRMAADVRADSAAATPVPGAPTMRPRGEPPRQPANKELRDAMRFLLDLP